MTEEVSDDVGQVTELALPGDLIRARHIATRASNRRRIVVLTLGDAEFEGYSIGLDEHCLQLLELPSGEVSTITLDYIVSISDDKPFNQLTPDEKDIVDRRTSSFRKTSQTWLITNWPNVYDKRGEDEDRHRVTRTPYVRPLPARYDSARAKLVAEEIAGHGNQEVRD